MNRSHVIVLAASMLFSHNAWSHEAKGPNGGRIVDAGNYHVELVISGDAVNVFVSDADNKPVAPAGFKALAILNHGGKAQRVSLTPAEGKLSGKIEGTMPGNVKGVVQLTTPAGKIASGQYR
jgi:hypothetical protein